MGARRRIAALTRSLPLALAAFGLAQCTSAPQLAAAQTPTGLSLPSSVRLQLDPCNSAKYDANAFSDLLRVDLRGIGIERLDVEPTGAGSEAHAAGDLALIHLGCGSIRGTLAIELADLVGGNRVSREVVVDDVPASGRAHALSLAIVSLLESSWSLLATRPPEAAVDGGPARMPPSVRAALRRRLSAYLTQPSMSDTTLAAAASETDSQSAHRSSTTRQPQLALRASLVGRAFPSRGSGVTGFAVSLAPRLAPLLELAFDLEAMYGRQALNAGGPVDELDTLWLGAGTTLYFATTSRPRFQIGPTLRAAYVHVLTSTDDKRFLARDAGGWIAMVGASSLLHFELTPAWDLFFGADIAYVPGGASFRADATSTVGFADLALALRLGISWNR